MQIQQCKYDVVDLSKEDVDWFVDVAVERMLREEVDRPDLINKIHMRILVDKSLSKEAPLFALIAKVDGQPVGAIAGITIPHLFNPDVTSTSELVWYVLPEFRNTRVGLLLVKAFEGRARMLSSDVTMCLLSTSPVNTSSLEKRGYILKELSFRKEF